MSGVSVVSGWLFHLLAGICVASAAALVLGPGDPRRSLPFLLCNVVAVGALCALLGAFWIGLLHLLLAGGAAAWLLSLASAELGPAEPPPPGGGFPLVAVLGAGVALAALLRLAAFVAGLDLPAADPAPGFGGVRALAFWLFADRVLISVAISLLALVALITAMLSAPGPASPPRRPEDP